MLLSSINYTNLFGLNLKNYKNKSQKSCCIWWLHSKSSNSKRTSSTCKGYTKFKFISAIKTINNKRNENELNTPPYTRWIELINTNRKLTSFLTKKTTHTHFRSSNWKKRKKIRQKRPYARAAFQLIRQITGKSLHLRFNGPRIGKQILASLPPLGL